MTKINNIFDNIDSLCCRSFDIQDTLRLLHYPNPSIFWSWGAEQKINYDNKGLLLKVNAHRHKGWLLISLSGADLYDVHLFQDKAIKKSITDIFFEDLLRIIDDEIERINEYEI